MHEEGMKLEVSLRDKPDDLDGRRGPDFGMVLIWFARKYTYEPDRFPSDFPDNRLSKCSRVYRLEGLNTFIMPDIVNQILISELLVQSVHRKASRCSESRKKAEFSNKLRPVLSTSFQF